MATLGSSLARGECLQCDACTSHLGLLQILTLSIFSLLVLADSSVPQALQLRNQSLLSTLSTTLPPHTSLPQSRKEAAPYLSSPVTNRKPSSSSVKSKAFGFAVLVCSSKCCLELHSLLWASWRVLSAVLEGSAECSCALCAVCCPSQEHPRAQGAAPAALSCTSGVADQGCAGTSVHKQRSLSQANKCLCFIFASCTSF